MLRVHYFLIKRKKLFVRPNSINQGNYEAYLFPFERPEDHFLN